MKVILIRHGQAEGYRQPDSGRQLTEKGRQQADETARYILNKYTPDRFVVSPYDRARQTLQAFSFLAPDVPVQVLNNITPNDNASQAIDALSEIDAECLLVVCHMPIVANMAGLLVNEWATSYSLAEARVIECEVLAEGLGSQIDVFIPSQ